MPDLESTILPHLRTQFERARAILFTGSGFSTNAKNLEGRPLPSGPELARSLWQLCFPSDPFDTNVSLQDIYEAALATDPKGLADLLTRSLTVDADSIPDWLARYFSLPWYRVYTLNIDSLAQAINRRFPVPRTLQEISATGPIAPKRAADAPHATLEAVYLNGTLADVPDRVTFSASQYAHRLAFPGHLYQQLVADVVSRPVVFVGTKLDEPPLWQNIELRRERGRRGLREMRPRSYLVTPTLDRAREARLSNFNITWIPMTAEEFAHHVLSKLGPAVERGLAFFQVARVSVEQEPRLPEVADLATNPHRESEFLLGEEPIWADIQTGRAVERDCDGEF